MTIRSHFRRLADARVPRLAGLALAVAGMALYRSYEQRTVLGLWSPAYFAFLVLAVGILGVAVVSTLRAWRARRSVSRWSVCFDLAVLAWGGASLCSALDDPSAGGRLLEGNVVGSTVPFAALLEWVALCGGAAAALGAVAQSAGSRGQTLLLGVGAVLSVLLAGEGLLRLRNAIAPLTQGFPTYASLQWQRRHVTLNADGFRDVEHPREAPPGTRRLLVVGDSFAFGSGIENPRDRLGERTAALLSEPGPERWVSLNASRGNSHTLQELRFLEQMSGYAADVVLLVYVFNDIDYLVSDGKGHRLAGHPQGLLGRIAPSRLLFLNSCLFQELYVRVRLASYAWRGTDDDSGGPFADASLLERHLDDLDRLAASARARGARFLVLPFDLPLPSGELAPRYATLVDGLARRGHEVVSLEGAIDALPREQLVVNALDGHPNELANRIAAERVAEKLRQLGWAR